MFYTVQSRNDIQLQQLWGDGPWVTFQLIEFEGLVLISLDLNSIETKSEHKSSH